MVTRKTALPLALIASAALAVPGAQAAGNPTGPVAHAAGSDAPALNPAVVGNAITRTDAALGSAADFIDQADGASAAKPLTAARRYLIRSYTGAKYLIAHPPPAPADAGSANPARFVTQARRLVRRSRQERKAGRWVRARVGGARPPPPGGDRRAPAGCVHGVEEPVQRRHRGGRHVSRHDRDAAAEG